MLADPGIIRNRAKIEAVIHNAGRFLAVQAEFGTFDAYLWRFVSGQTIVNAPASWKTTPAQSPESIALAADLSKRGFWRVGPTLCYAFMQVIGMVNDHIVGCYRGDELIRYDLAASLD